MEILEAMAKYPKVCNYLDIPLQHASDSVLERMKRQTTREEQKKLIERAREMVPGICIRTTFLVGFPGENEDEFNELCTFVEEMQFERDGGFQYYHEEDTLSLIHI